MRPDPLSGVGCLLRLLRARGTGTRGTFVFGALGACGVFGALFVLALCFLGLRCADAGHPPGLFAE